MAGIGANVGAGLSQGYSQSANSGGSVNSAENNTYSYNESWNDSVSDSMSEAYSWTEANMARMWSAYMADVAWQRDMQAFQQQMDFNREEAQKQRDWQAQMANTIYTRSVKNMKEAGINPILAYRMGLSGAGVGSGATASLGGSPQAPLAQNFMDSYSASNSRSHSESNGGSFGESWGTGTQSGSSWNSGWSNSEEGIVTALQGLGDMADTALAGIQSGQALDKMNQWVQGGGKMAGKITNQVVNGVKDFIGSITDKIQQKVFDDNEAQEKPKYTGTGGGGGHGFNKKMKSF